VVDHIYEMENNILIKGKLKEMNFNVTMKNARKYDNFCLYFLHM